MAVPTHSVVAMNVQQQLVPLQVALLHMPPPVAALVVPLAAPLAAPLAMALDVAVVVDPLVPPPDAVVPDVPPLPVIPVLVLVPVLVPVCAVWSLVQGCGFWSLELPLAQLTTRHTPATKKPRPCQNVQRMNGKRIAIPRKNASLA